MPNKDKGYMTLGKVKAPPHAMAELKQTKSSFL